MEKVTLKFIFIFDIVAMMLGSIMEMLKI